MAKHLMIALSIFIFAIIFGCSKKSNLSFLEKKRGVWALVLEKKKIGCSSGDVYEQQIDTFSMNFLDDKKVVKQSKIQSDTLYWKVEQAQDNKRKTILTFTGMSGYEHQKYYVTESSKKSEQWYWDGGCFFNYRTVYSGILTKN